MSGCIGFLLPVLELAAIWRICRAGHRRYPVLLSYLALSAAAQTAVLLAPSTQAAVKPLLAIVRALALLELCGAGKYRAACAIGCQAVPGVIGSLFARQSAVWDIIPRTMATWGAINDILWWSALAAVAWMVAELEPPARSTMQNITVMPQFSVDQIRRAALRLNDKKYPEHAKVLARREAELRVHEMPRVRQLRRCA
jgi:hypothetical protein